MVKKYIISVFVLLLATVAMSQITVVDFGKLYSSDQNLGSIVAEKGFVFFGDDNGDGVQSGDNLKYITSSSKGGLQANWNSFSSGGALVVKSSTAFDFVEFYAEEPNGIFLNIKIDGYLDGVKVATKSLTLSPGVSEKVALDNSFNNVDEVRFLGTDGFGVQQLFDGFTFGPVISFTPGEIIVNGDLSNPIKEGSKDSLSFKLNQEPTSSVYLAITTARKDVLGISLDTLMFDNSNWDIEQKVFISAIQNAIDEGGNVIDTVLVSVINSLSGDEFDDLSNEFKVTVENDDKAGVNFVVSSDTLLLYENEDGKQDDTVFVSLVSEPIDSVFISYSVSGHNNLLPQTDSVIIFTKDNWSKQSVTVMTAFDDKKVGDVTFTFTANMSSNDPNYDEVSFVKQGVIMSDDTARIVFDITNDSTVTTGVGGKDSVYVQLLAEPQDEEVITVSITVNNDNEISFSTNTLMIDTSNWDQRHLVVLTGKNGTDRMSDTTYEVSIVLSSSLKSSPFSGLTDMIQGLNKHDDPLSIFSSGRKTQVQAYPVPANDQVTLVSEIGIQSVICSTLNGTPLNVSYSIEANKVELNTSRLESGIYLVQLVTENNKVLTKKIIVE